MKKRILPIALALFGGTACFGQVWAPKAENTLPANYTVADISIVNDQVIWATAVDWAAPMPTPATFVSKILKSTDGGDTWTVKDAEETMSRICWDIHAFDENTACITTQNFGSGNGRGIFRTIDGGETWTETFNNVAGGVWLHFFDNQEGICINADLMARTTNGGQSWSNVPGGNIPNFGSNEGTLIWSTCTSLEAIGDILWFGTTNGRIFKSTNRGQNWSAFTTGLGSNAEMNSIAFVDESNGLASYFLPGSGRRLGRTADGGLTWQFVANTNLLELTAIPCTRTIVGVSYVDNQTHFSTDLGQTWTQVDAQLSAYAPVFNSPGLGWLANGGSTGANAALFKWAGEELYGRTFVNKNATGNTDGTSWADAYTDFQSALAAAEAGDEIWVAEGTYLPAAPGSPQTSTFLINKNLKLYGGFAGSECSLSERDIVLHPTILSGDLNGNDVVGNPTANKLDNVLHVVTVNANITNETVMDGFTIRNGYADGGGNLSDGGGMICSGKPVIRLCILEQNVALSGGGAVRLNSIGSPGIVFEDCLFNQNRANVGGGISIQSSYFTISGCIFSDNAAVSGASQAAGGGLQIGQSSGQVNNCDFIGNQSALYGGGLLAIDYLGSPGNSNVEVSDCNFEDNSAGNNDGGLSFNSWVSNNSYSARRCTFDNNTAAFQGGGMTFYAQAGSSNTNVLVDSCHFSGNTSNGSSAAAAFMNGTSTTFELTNSTFENNNTIAWYATAAVYSGGTGSALVDNCVFQNNNSVHSAGLDIGGSGDWDFAISNCDFLQNHADSVNAGFDIWADVGSSLNFTIENCVIDGNTAGERAAGLWVIPASDDFQATMKNCRIVNNQSPKGAAIDIFREAVSGFPALENASFTIENCLIANNSSDSGVVALDTLRHFNLLNCTIADNTGGGILNGNLGGLTLQNTILANPDHVEYTASTNSTVTSNGGNLVLDNSLNAALTAQDKPETAPDFESGTYEPSSTSPLINAGVNAGVTAATDLAGNPRIVGGTVDIGAYESLFTKTKEVVVGSLSMSPNPATDLLYPDLPDNAAPTSLAVFDAQGRLVLSQQFAAGGALRVGHLPGGVFTVKMTDGERVYVGKFIKQ